MQHWQCLNITCQLKNNTSSGVTFLVDCQNEYNFSYVAFQLSCRMVLKETSGPCDLVLERPFAPFPIHQLHQNEDYHLLFNKGRVPLTSWNGALLSSKLNESSEGNGNPGFAIFSPRLLNSHGWAVLSSEQDGLNQRSTSLANRISEIVGLYSDEDDADTEWAHGSFPLEEYIKALDRAKGELYYNHSLGMQYSKVIVLL